MSLATIDNNNNKSGQQDFDKYFAGKDLFELFKYDPEVSHCETMDLLLKRDGFPIVECPTNIKHVKYLREMEHVAGISLNSNLYSNNESQEKVQEPSRLIVKRKEPERTNTLIETS